jgi:quinoprotein glucose dehydrogenase
LIDLTPALRREALAIVAQYDHGPLFTPPSLRGTILVPGIVGGASWSGAAIDPETGMLYVGTNRMPFVVTVRQPTTAEASYDYIGQFRYLSGPRGLPLLKPPWGSMVAIDMNTGEHRWRVPVGRGELLAPVRQLGLDVERLGFAGRSWALVTRTVMIVVQMGYYSANFDPHLWVYDKETGALLAEVPLPANATGSPITYTTGGKQYVVFPVGGGSLADELLAVAL